MAVKMFAPYDLRPTILITAFTLTGVSTLVVAGRLYCRMWVVGRLKLYDYIMLLALLLTWGLCVCNHYQLMFGSGAQGTPPLPPLSPEQLFALLRYLLHGSAASWYAYHISYLAIMGLIKLSILIFYLSFATHRTFRKLVHLAIVIVAAVSLVMIFIIAFQCPKDPSYALTEGIFIDRGIARCMDLRVVFYWQAGFNIGSDLAILILPMPLLLSLQMHRSKRISLLAVFSIGLLVPIASGVRLWGLYLWAHSGMLARWSGGYILFWTQVEINTAIICASAPSYQPLLKRVFGELSIFQRSRGAYYYYGGRNSVDRPPVVEINRTVPQDSVGIPQPPSPVYQPPKLHIENEFQTQMVTIKRSAEEEELRNRIRAFSSQSSMRSQPPSPSSVVSSPISPIHPEHVLRDGCV